MSILGNFLHLLIIFLIYNNIFTYTLLNMEKAYFAGGCFWCLEAIFKRVKGVISVDSGYCNGDGKRPTYEYVCSGNSGYVEVVSITFDTSIVFYYKLLEVFFKIHNPTTLNKQGADVGTQYRSGVYYVSKEQENCANKYIKTLENSKDIVTEVLALDNFYLAEDYHQNYFANNKNNPYCQLVITPKLEKYF